VFILYTKHEIILIAHTMIKINSPRRLRTASRRCATPGWLVSVSVWVVFWCYLGVNWVLIGYLSDVVYELTLTWMPLILLNFGFAIGDISCITAALNEPVPSEIGCES
jgi:hypothetical protein